MSKKANSVFFWVLLAFVVVGVVVGLWRGAVFFFALGDDGQRASHAQFGDFIAGIAGGLGLLGMVLALLLQTRELNLQRKELRATQDIMRQQKRESEEQTEAMRSQASAMRSMATAMTQQAASLGEQIELQREMAAAQYTTQVKSRWRLGKNAQLIMRNYGGGEAQVRFEGVTDESRPTIDGHTVADMRQHIGRSMEAEGARNVEVTFPGKLAEALVFTLGGNQEQHVLSIAPQQFPVPEKAVQALCGIRLTFSVGDPERPRYDVTVSLDYLADHWRPER